METEGHEIIQCRWASGIPKKQEADSNQLQQKCNSRVRGVGKTALDPPSKRENVNERK